MQINVRPGQSHSLASEAVNQYETGEQLFEKENALWRTPSK
jgi:hypothetical protein